MWRLSKRDFIKAGGLALAAAGATLVGWKAVGSLNHNNDGEKLGKEVEGQGLFGESLPYLQETTRINPEVSLPEDVIGAEDLWRSYHTRIWSGEETKLFLRPGIKELQLFKDLSIGEAKSLDIVMFDDKCELTEEQRANMNPDLVAAFGEKVEKDGFGAGLFLSLGDGVYGVFCRKYSTADNDYSPHLLESYPSVDGGWAATYNTPAITLRHEFFHYDFLPFSNQNMDTELFVGTSIEESIRNAEENLKYWGSDEGYFVVYEIKEGVVIS